VLLVVLGGVAIAYDRNVVSPSLIGDAWRLWPLILVGIGLKFVLSRTPISFAGGLIVAITIGLIAGSLFAVGPTIGCGSGSAQRLPGQSGTFEGASSVDLHIQCGRADVATSSDGRWHVDATSDSGRGPSVTSGPDSLVVETALASGWNWDAKNGNVLVSIPTNTPISLSVSQELGDSRYSLNSATLTSATFILNLGSARIDLTGARVDNLSVSTNLGSAFVILDGSSGLTGDLRADLGSLDVCVPDGLGLRITTSDSLSSSDWHGLNMQRSGNDWQTANFDTASHKAILTVNTSLGSLKLHTAGDCK
jgi:hypothetical protein